MIKANFPSRMAFKVTARQDSSTILGRPGAEHLLVTAIGRDGMLTGPDLDLLTMIRWLAPESRVIASGGVASLRDLKEAAARGADAAVVGRAFYEGFFTYEEAVAAAGG